MANPKNNWNREKNLIELLSFLTQVKEATFETIREKLKVSQPTLTTYLKTLETQEKIEHFDKIEDRRHTWYRIKEQKRKTIEAQIGQSEGIKFIENFMKNCDRITVDGVEPEWIRTGYTWVDESTGESLYFTVTVERKNPKVFLMLNPHLKKK
jgi:DNA-binding transcriptional ArsR family regulator